MLRKDRVRVRLSFTENSPGYGMLFGLSDSERREVIANAMALYSHSLKIAASVKNIAPAVQKPLPEPEPMKQRNNAALTAVAESITPAPTVTANPVLPQLDSTPQPVDRQHRKQFLSKHLTAALSVAKTPS